MVKVKYATNSPARPRRGKGMPVVVNDPRGTFVRSAPRFSSDKKTYWRWWMRQEFSIAARWASSPEPLSYLTAVEMAKNTEFIPRDIIMMASMGTYYEIIMPDGTKMEPGRMATSNVQYILDLLDPEVGAVIARTSNGWWALEPGTQGQVLTMDGAWPGWKDAQGGSGGGAKAVYAYNATPSTSLPTGTRGVRLQPTFATEIASFQLYGTWTNGHMIGVKVFEANGNSLGALVGETALKECPATGVYDMNIDLPSKITLAADTDYWIMCWKDGGMGLYTSGARIMSGLWLTLSQSAPPLGGYGTSGEPLTGQTLSTGGSPLAVVLIGA